MDQDQHGTVDTPYYVLPCDGRLWVLMIIIQYYPNTVKLVVITISPLPLRRKVMT